MTDKHKRHDPTHVRAGNDFATKKEVVTAVRNMTRVTETRLASVEALLAHLATPWYARLWGKIRRAA